jgi:toxic protein SymE
MDRDYLPLNGKVVVECSFIDGMPVKIRVMKDCIVLRHNIHASYGMSEGMSVVNII